MELPFVKCKKIFVAEDYQYNHIANKYNINNVIENEEILNNLKILHEHVTSKILDLIPEGYVLYRMSGYRTPQVNEKVGSKPTSQHVLGQAQDLILFDDKGQNQNNLLFDTIADNLVFDKLVKVNVRNNIPACVHVSYKNDDTNENMKIRL